MRETNRLLEETEHTLLFNPYALHEIRLPGLMATGRTDIAVQLVEQGSPIPTTTVAPQWRVIELITVAQVRLAAYDCGGAVQSLHTAVDEAVRQCLPHQLQRIARAAHRRLPEIREVADHALDVTTECAAKAGHPPLRALALTYASYGAPTPKRKLEVLSQASQDVRGHGNATAAAWVLGRHAEESAAASDETGALRALDRARFAYDFADHTSEQAWVPLRDTVSDGS
ncbi:hypothetical protein [Streptomyces cyaneus]|uniref:hypothetical protein n=1 Tax=Streptomyces cyaneus TaxID=1904 RepID=UPI003CCC7157